MIIDRKLISHLFLWLWSLHQNKPCVVWISSWWWTVYNWCFYVCVFCSVHGPLRVWQTCLLSVTASIVYNSHSQLTFITLERQDDIFFLSHSWTIFLCVFKGLLHILLAYQTWKQVISSFCFSVLLNQEVRSQRCILNVASLNLKAP